MDFRSCPSISCYEGCSCLSNFTVTPTSRCPTVADSSDFAVGAVLQQFVNDSWQPISRKLKPSETRYSTFDRELLAIYLAIKHFQHYVEGQNFCVLTDHKPLTYSLFCTLCSRYQRQAWNCINWPTQGCSPRVRFCYTSCNFYPYPLAYTLFRCTSWNFYPYPLACYTLSFCSPYGYSIRKTCPISQSTQPLTFQLVHWWGSTVAEVTPIIVYYIIHCN